MNRYRTNLVWHVGHFSKNEFGSIKKLMHLPLYCRYDILVSRNVNLGNATRVSYRSHISLVDDLKRGECKQ